MKNKILTILLVIFFSVTILNLNEVFGIGIVSQSWKEDINRDGKADLVYRVFLHPLASTVEEYHKVTSSELVENGQWRYKYNGQYYTSKWEKLLGSTQATIGGYSGYLTARYAFHTEPLGNYDNGEIGGKYNQPYNCGQVRFNYVSPSKGQAPITDSLGSIQERINKSEAKDLNPRLNRKYSSVDAAYNDLVFYELYRINGSYGKVNNDSTGFKLSGNTFNKNTQYRMALVEIGGVNIMVYDHVIYNEDLNKLVKAAKDAGMTDGCYVSQNLIARSYDGNYYNVSRIVKDFFKQGQTWSYVTCGRSEKAFGSVANLFDNELIFPQLSRRTVLVRHINVGNNTTISTDIINNSSRIPSNDLTIKANEDIIRGKNSSNYYSGYEEYYEEMIDVDKTVTKQALQDTYKCLGYNVSVSPSYDSAVAGINQTISNGNIRPGTTATVPGKSELGESDFVIIDFYYTEYEKDVTVNHYYTDINGVVREFERQTIVPNTTANSGTLKRINSDLYIKEVYPKKVGEDVVVTKADSLKDDNDVKYQGFELFTEQDITAGKVVGIGEQGKYENKSETARLTSEHVQVNFYYTREGTELLVEPEKKINGKVFVKNSENISATCSDETNEEKPYSNVVSIPSGSKAIVGIKDIPKYMLGAITSEYVSPADATHKMNLTIKLTMGKQQDRKVELKNIPYKVGYYKITDMAVYKLTSANVYDAEARGINTVGSGLFSWEEKALQLDNMGYSVTMQGVNGKIDNDNIDDIDNYVTAHITGTSKTAGVNIESEKNSMDDEVLVTYINEIEFNKVDANNDSQINEEDKTYAQNTLGDKWNALEQAKSNEESANQNYVAIYEEQQSLKEAYDTTAKEEERLKAIYDEADKEYDEKKSIASGINNDIILLRDTTIPNLKSDLDTAQEGLTTLNGSLTTAQSELTNLNSELSTLETENKNLVSTRDTYKTDVYDPANTRLTNAQKNQLNIEQNSQRSQEYINWQTALDTLSNLEKEIECEDDVDEDEYIDLEQEEKDAIDRCKEVKKEYEEQRKLVAELEKIYDSYLEDQKTLAQNEVKEAQNAFNEINAIFVQMQTDVNTSNTNITNKNNEITDKQNQISNIEKDIEDKEDQISNIEKDIKDREAELKSAQSLYKTATRDKQKYYKKRWQPAHNNYYNYFNNTYTPAKEAYDNYVEAGYLTTAYNEWQAAITTTKQAQNDYDEYKTYKETLESLYESYKAMYDEFTQLTDENAATKLDLTLNITAQNMSVAFKVGKDDAKLLTKSEKNSNTKSYKVTDLQDITDEDDKRIPQVTTDPIIIDKEYYNNIQAYYYDNKYEDEQHKTIEDSDYRADNNDYINKEILNGVRVLAGDIEYRPLRVIGNENKNAVEIIDNIYYSEDGKVDDRTKIFKLASEKITRKYEINNEATEYEEKHKHVEPINIYTPITVSAELVTDVDDIVNQTQNLDKNTSMIQLNSQFTISLDSNAYERNYKINNTKKYVEGYYIKFDFDVYNVFINGKKYNNGDRVSAGAWLGIIRKDNEGNATIKAQVYGNINQSDADIISEDKGTYTVRAAAYNATDLMLNDSLKYDALSAMIEDTSDMKDDVYNICTNPSYFAETTKYNVLIVNRIFDFRVTDVKDINWKSVFRKNAGSNTNNHSSIVYYAGMTKWNTKSNNSNDITPRTTSEIGKNPLRTLPIGPYKNTSVTYIKAPKLGYRFSFDMKVTGSYYNKQGEPRENKKVNIATKFYYVSKDGTKYWKEYDGTSEGIYLFYKTSNGKYVRIDENGGGYNLTFTPNDGYRYLDKGDETHLAKSVVSLGNLRNISLTYNMATVDNNGAVITYYGEYKLPNSTIAVKVKQDGSYDINKPLKDGYIGVVFDIVAESGANASSEVQLSYSKDTKDQPNTSQWDYEGFLGNLNHGKAVTEQNDVTLKLERGTWRITDNEKYNEIKGSVMLYDLDERAATDYE